MELWSTLGWSGTSEGGLGKQEGSSIGIFNKNVGTGTNLERQGVNTLQQVPLVWQKCCCWSCPHIVLHRECTALHPVKEQPKPPAIQTVLNPILLMAHRKNISLCSQMLCFHFAHLWNINNTRPSLKFYTVEFPQEQGAHAAAGVAHFQNSLPRQERWMPSARGLVPAQGWAPQPRRCRGAVNTRWKPSTR